MASQEVDDDVADGVISGSPEALNHRIEYWASSVDAFLQDFRDKTTANDRIGALIAAARLAQIGSAMSQEYKATAGMLADSDTDLKIAQQACAIVVGMTNDNGNQCHALKRGEVVLATNTPDRSLS